MPRSSSSKTFSITGKVSKRCFVGFDFKALDMQSLGSMGGRCSKAELHTILQIWSIVSLYIGLFYSSSKCKLHDRGNSYTCAVGQFWEHYTPGILQHFALKSAEGIRVPGGFAESFQCKCVKEMRVRQHHKPAGLNLHFIFFCDFVPPIKISL